MIQLTLFLSVVVPTVFTADAWPLLVGSSAAYLPLLTASFALRLPSYRPQVSSILPHILQVYHLSFSAQASRQPFYLLGPCIFLLPLCFVFRRFPDFLSCSFQDLLLFFTFAGLFL